MVYRVVFSLRFLLSALLAFVGMGAFCAAQAEGAYDWSALSAVERVAIVHPFFAKLETKAKPSDEQDKDYQKDLQQLTVVLKKTLVTRLKEQHRFSLVPDAKVDQALRSLHWKASDLFLNKGVVAGKGWPQPDSKRLSLLARRLNVDAILIGKMAEPASIGDSAEFRRDVPTLNPLGHIQRIRPHVISPRVQTYLVTVAGIVAWRDEQMADHPRTSPRTMRNLFLDWREATEQVAGQIADSLLRMPPPDR